MLRLYPLYIILNITIESDLTCIFNTNFYNKAQHFYLFIKLYFEINFVLPIKNNESW